MTAVILAVFLAASVEAVEALTIVLAVGTLRGWRPALAGAGSAIFILGAAIALAGKSVSLLPMTPLRLLVGAGAVLYGAKWLKKAILRASGRKAHHDEDAIYASTSARLAAERPNGWVSYGLAAKAVLVEGLEVVIIAVTMGTASHELAPAGLAALAACLVVAVAGIIAGRQLSAVPENALKLVVSVLLCSSGTFWLGEGAGVHWPGADLSLLGIIGVVAVSVWVVVGVLRRERSLARPWRAAKVNA